MGKEENIPLYRIKLIDQSLHLDAGTELDIFLEDFAIGRDKAANLCYPDYWLAVSGKHAHIKALKNKVFLERDPAAKNHTIVNGRKIIKPKRLKKGDEIQLSLGGPRFKLLNIGAANTTKQGSTVLNTLIYVIIALALIMISLSIWLFFVK